MRTRMVVLAALVSSLPTVASADPTDPFATTLGIGGGVSRLSSPEFRASYGGGPAVTELEVGKRLSRFVEVSASGAYARASGRGTPWIVPVSLPATQPQPYKGVDHRVDLPTPTPPELVPPDQLELKLWSVTTSGKLRLDIRPEQGVVPFVGAGVAWIDGRERIKNRAVPRKSGDALGWIYSAGVEVRLDAAERDRADILQSQWGIDDTFLTLQVDRTQMDNFGRDAPVDLSGWRLHGSLKFAF